MATSIVDAIRKGAIAGNLAIANAAQKTNTPIKQNSPAAQAVAATQPNYVSMKDPITGQTLTVKPAGQGGYMNAYEAYANSANAQANRQKQYLQQTLKDNNATTNANYDSAARQAYVDYMKKQKDIAGQLAGLGVNGGASETGQLNLYNQYGQAHATNEAQRNAELSSNQKAYNDAWNEYYENLQTDLREKQQTAINNQINEYNNEITRFSSSVAQYPTTEKGYKQYNEWIKQLKASNDPLKDMKIALVKQQMASQFPDGKPKDKSSGGGSGGGGSRRRSRSYSSGSKSGGGNSKKTTNTTKSASKAYRDKVTAQYASQGKSSGSRTIGKKKSGVNRTQDSSKNKNRR